LKDFSQVFMTLHYLLLHTILVFWRISQELSMSAP
jgi:hypothetical protein